MARLIQPTEVPGPGAPGNLEIITSDDTSAEYLQHYFDDGAIRPHDFTLTYRRAKR